MSEENRSPEGSSPLRRYLPLVLVLALVAGYLLLNRPKTSLPATPTGERLLQEASAAAKDAGCGPIRNVGPYTPESADRNHIGSGGQVQPPLSSYPSTPPASGPHAPAPLDAGVYPQPPEIYAGIHSLEHGAAQIWYAPGVASSSPVRQITSFFGRADKRDHVIVAPYAYPNAGAAGRLATGIQMALVSWHHVQLCKSPSLAAAFDFVAHYRFPPVTGRRYLGDAPEQGAGI